MRYTTLSVLSLLIVPMVALAVPQTAVPTTAPDSKSELVAALSGLFELPHSRQLEVRRQLERDATLPADLAGLLGHSDPTVRRTSLALLRDNYGDWQIVPAIQTLLGSELARGAKADGYVIAACCEILADWPRWDSVPVLVAALKTEQRISGQNLSVRYNRVGQVAVWRQADATLRLLSGEWPMPEPDVSSQQIIPPGSAQDVVERQELENSWAEWWLASGTMVDPMPQVRLELSWSTPAVRQAAGPNDEFSAVASSLWVRPTGLARVLRLAGRAESSREPAWKWDDRTRRDCEVHLNALQADAARSLVSAVTSGGGTSGAWGIERPVGLPENWHGRIMVTLPDGQTGSVELADRLAPGAVQPPDQAGDALGELIPLVVTP